MLAARALLVVLALVSLAGSPVPRSLALPAMLVLACLCAARLRRAHRLPPASLRIADDGRWLVLREGAGPPRLFERARVQVRGSLAWVEAVGPDGRRRGWAWWPDTLDADGLRRLRLASRGPGAHSAAAIATMPG
jgi:hypothetical protein